MKRWVRRTGLVVALVGLVLVGRGLYEAAGGSLYQMWHKRQLDSALNQAPAKPRHLRVNPYKEGDIIGRLEIPRIGLSTMVMEGDNDSELRLGAGRVIDSPLPGEQGNVVVAGHRDTYFRPLREIRDGDRVDLKTPNGTYHYVVSHSQVVDQSDIAVLGKTPQPSLTLVTCYPFDYIGPAPKRFIVQARLDQDLPVTPTVTTAQPPAPVAKPSAFALAAAAKPRARKVDTAPARVPGPASPAPAAVAPVGDPTMLAAADPAAATVTTAEGGSPVAESPVADKVTPASPPAKHGIAKLNPVGLFRKIGRAIKRKDQE